MPCVCLSGDLRYQGCFWGPATKAKTKRKEKDIKIGVLRCDDTWPQWSFFLDTSIWDSVHNMDSCPYQFYFEFVEGLSHADALEGISSERRVAIRSIDASIVAQMEEAAADYPKLQQLLEFYYNAEQSVITISDFDIVQDRSVWRAAVYLQLFPRIQTYSALKIGMSDKLTLRKRSQIVKSDQHGQPERGIRCL